MGHNEEGDYSHGHGHGRGQDLWSRMPRPNRFLSGFAQSKWYQEEISLLAMMMMMLCCWSMLARPVGGLSAHFVSSEMVPFSSDGEMRPRPVTFDFFYTVCQI